MQVYHLTESLTVLQWVNAAQKKQQVLVVIQIRDFLDFSSVDEWRNVNSTMNPADTGTRGMTVSQLIENEWLIGTAWISYTQEMYFGHLKLEMEPNIEESNRVTHARKSVFDWSRILSYEKLINTLA